MQEVGAGIDLTRVHFLGKVAYRDHVQLLQRSDAHIYLSYPFVASWSLREALAIGAPVIGGDTPTVTEFVKHNETGLVTPTLDPAQLAQTVLKLLKDQALAQRLSANARRFAEASLDLNAYLAHYCQEIERITGKSLTAPKAKPATKPTAKSATKPKPKPAARQSKQRSARS